MNEEHFCNEHGVRFFKKGAMKGWGHPIGNTDKWCNEPIGEHYFRSHRDTASGTVRDTQQRNPDSERCRSMALAYAKDWSLGKLKAGSNARVSDVISTAILFEAYIINGATVTEGVTPKDEESTYSEEDTERLFKRARNKRLSDLASDVSDE